jgi:hypothetical protein
MIYRHPESFHVPFQDLLFSTTSTTMIGTNLHPVQLALETLCVNHLPKVVAKPTVTWSNRKTKRQSQEQDDDQLDGDCFDSNIVEESNLRKRQKSIRSGSEIHETQRYNKEKELMNDEYEEEISTSSEISDDQDEDEEEQVITFGNTG